MSRVRVLALALCGLPLFAQTTPRCAPSPEDKQWLSDLTKPGPDNSPAFDRRTEIVAALEKRLNELEWRDPFLLRNYLSYAAGPLRRDRETLSSAIEQRAAATPANPVLAWAYADSLIGRDTPKAIPLLRALRDQKPDHPQVHLSLIRIYSSPAFKDHAQVETLLEEYSALCPDLLNGYSMASQLDATPGLTRIVTTLRAKIAGRSDDEALGVYRWLWAAEFKVRPLSEHAALREQVARDLEIFRALPPDKQKTFGWVMSEGYRLTGDSAAAKAATANSGLGSPMNEFFQADQEWRKANPIGKDLAAFNKKRLAFIDEWRTKSPKDTFLLYERLRLLSEMPDTPLDEMLSVADAVLEHDARMRKGGMISFGMPMIGNVMRAYLKRDVRVEQVPGLARVAIEGMNNQPDEHASDLYPPPPNMNENRAWMRWTGSFEIWSLLAEAETKLGHAPEARAALARMDTLLGEARSEIAKKEQEKKEQEKKQAGAAGPAGILDMRARALPWHELRHQTLLAELAVKESRTLDALTYYQSALRTALQHAQPETRREEIRTKASALWKSLGGTTEGWQKWLDQAQPSTAATTPTGTFAAGIGGPGWTPMRKDLGNFAFPDQFGKNWTVATLKGKTTFINLWATWCGPCREELPQVQKLHDQLKGREDIAVITLNVDDNIGLVEPFLKENKYTFPVLLAKTYVESIAGMISIPRNWTIDRTPALREEMVGFNPTHADKFVAEMTKKIEELRDAKP